MNSNFVAAAALACSALFASPAIAITHGEADAGEHPYVGMAAFYDSAGTYRGRCSGTLVSPHIFITAGHCTTIGATAKIWFEEDVEAGMPGNGFPYGSGAWVEGETYTHPQYVDSDDQFLDHDLGVIKLGEPVYLAAYAQLPTIGLLEEFATRRGQNYPTMEAVGYGLQYRNPVRVEAYRARLKTTLNVISVRGAFGLPAQSTVVLSGNANTGGTCFGDSGGPLFYRETTIVGAVVSSGPSPNCFSGTSGYRLDQPDDLDWLHNTFGLLIY